MKLSRKLFSRLSVLTILVITACSVPIYTQTPLAEKKITPTAFQPEATDVIIAMDEKVNLYLSKQVPGTWRDLIQTIADVAIVEDIEDANLILEPTLGSGGENSLASFDKVFAVTVPFFTVDDEISFTDLETLWSGSSGDSDRKIYITQDIKDLLSVAWREPGANVEVGQSSDLLSKTKSSPRSLAIIPFEEIAPQWKILKIESTSPIDKPFKQEKYPLVISFNLMQTEKPSSKAISIGEKITALLPASNRDESKMTVVVMSGTTAITRGLAFKVTINDVAYPVALIKDWFLSADLRHVSNESPFVVDCPPPNPYTSSLVFCTQPDMIEVLDEIGINVVEMTGNHIKDYLDENLLYTLKMYEERGWDYYAAGINDEAARKPILVEHNGNKIAFIGCNAVGPSSVWANEARPGAAECDFEYLTQTIKELKSQGYTVITTFQHEELSQQLNSPTVWMFAEKISADFQTVAAAGADIVQGSQAHYPMGFEFVGDSLIHYGLGNFLFDQMWDPNRNEFIDRHIVYDGRYINTELLTAVLMDWSQPTPMTEEQRNLFLNEIFTASLKREK